MKTRQRIQDILITGLTNDHAQLDLDGLLLESLMSFAGSFLHALNQVARRNRLDIEAKLSSTVKPGNAVLHVKAFQKKTSCYVQFAPTAITYRDVTVRTSDHQPKLLLAQLLLEAVVDAA